MAEATERTALLVMDVQHGIIESSGTHAVLEPAGRAIEKARGAGVRVIFVRVGFRPGYPEAAAHNQNFGQVERSGEQMHQDHPATQVHRTVAPRPDEPVVLKRRVSAFSGSDLGVLLRAHRIEELVLCGVATSGVVLSTLREAADLDYRLTVLSDACADRDPEVHRVLLEKVFPRQAGVVTVEEWASTL